MISRPPSTPRRLELAPVAIRLPIATHFIDVSAPVVTRLNALGGIAVLGEIGTLPFGDGALDLICLRCHRALEDDRRLFQEIGQVLKDDGTLISCPCIDTGRRDDTSATRDVTIPGPAGLLGSHDRSQERRLRHATVQPALGRLGMWWLEHQPRRAMFWYNWVGMPLALRFQKPLKLVEGMIDATGVDEMIFVCHRRARSSHPAAAPV